MYDERTKTKSPEQVNTRLEEVFHTSVELWKKNDKGYAPAEVETKTHFKLNGLRHDDVIDPLRHLKSRKLPHLEDFREYYKQERSKLPDYGGALPAGSLSLLSLPMQVPTTDTISPYPVHPLYYNEWFNSILTPPGYRKELSSESSSSLASSAILPRGLYRHPIDPRMLNPSSIAAIQ